MVCFSLSSSLPHNTIEYSNRFEIHLRQYYSLWDLGSLYTGLSWYTAQVVQLIAHLAACMNPVQEAFLPSREKPYRMDSVLLKVASFKIWAKAYHLHCWAWEVAVWTPSCSDPPPLLPCACTRLFSLVPHSLPHAQILCYRQYVLHAGLEMKSALKLGNIDIWRSFCSLAIYQLHVRRSIHLDGEQFPPVGQYVTTLLGQELTTCK